MSFVQWIAEKAYLSELRYQDFIEREPYVAGKSYYGTPKDKNIVNIVFFTYIIIVLLVILLLLLSKGSSEERESDE